ncbi:hypothetical protein L9F63_021237 [Diploptera punctata]|uniref:MIF4G domain-containing protein n=1 Tax=Diploptera punctata TaxID=6984 RepID=A0AAD7ZQR3_DIPPU|nr:hypothetical protein L9F63_021237 [Diploptera punctata]
MKKQRLKQLIKANEDEDKEIKKLEKQLKLNKRKRKSVPRSFVEDGLGYVLEVCEQDNLKQTMHIDQTLNESGSEFEDDFALMIGSEEMNTDSESQVSVNSEEANECDFAISDSEVYDSNQDNDTVSKETRGIKRKVTIDETEANKKKLKKKSLLQNFVEENIGAVKIKHIEQEKYNGTVNEHQAEDYKKIKKEKTHKKENYDESDADNDEFESDELEENTDEEEDKQDDEYWEDIYGRTRDKQGHIIQLGSFDKVKETPENTKKQEYLIRLKKQMKGLINRLAESNMSSISSQIEELYMSNSRNDMNETLMSLLMESLVATVITPERLIMEHVMLIAILHANVGTEIGAHVLQTLVKKFNEILQVQQEIENKELDNIVLILSYLYNFKVFSAILMYNILDKLQQKAGEAVQLKNNARVKFMLEILLAIKNNNMTKIPNFDPSHIEHLKKLMKGFLRKGNYITELKISLEDLLKADERGRWWVVGSAWTGVLPGERENR